MDELILNYQQHIHNLSTVYTAKMWIKDSDKWCKNENKSQMKGETR